jgi:DNA replication and repair protein RecF
MADYGSYIFEQRTRFIDQLIPVFQQFYHFISSNENEKIDMSYQSHHQQDDIKVQLRATRERDKMLGFSTRGIHKDELEMMLNGYPIKRVGSQGQNKTFLIALKLAQFKFLKQTHHQPPILLLDDIFDKLDADRVRKIVELVSQKLLATIFIYRYQIVNIWIKFFYNSTKKLKFLKLKME